MTAEDVRERRGEPVILTYEDGRQRLGTIEWGDGRTAAFSIYCEMGGRAIVHLGSQWPTVAADPGAARPVWTSAT